MIGLRDLRIRRLGAVLAGVALYLQLAFASLGPPPLAVYGAPAGGFSEHALCLADAGTPAPAPPADGAPAAPTHDHGAFCCLWHSPPAVTPQAMLVPQPVAYAPTEPGVLPGVTLPAGPRRGPVNPRAPPSLT